MSPEEKHSLGESEEFRSDRRHYFEEAPHPYTLRVSRTADGVIISGRINSTDRKEISRQIEQLLDQLEQVLSAETSEAIETSAKGGVMGVSSEQAPEEPRYKSDERSMQENDILDWDNLIPVPPARPTGRIQVRLRKVGRDHPLPAEDPFAK